MDPKLRNLIIALGFSLFPVSAYFYVQANLIKATSFAVHQSKGELLAGDTNFSTNSYEFLDQNSSGNTLLFRDSEKLVLWQRGIGFYNLEIPLANIATAAISASGETLAITVSKSKSSTKLYMYIRGLGLSKNYINLAGTKWGLDFASSETPLVYSKSIDSFYGSHGPEKQSRFIRARLNGENKIVVEDFELEESFKRIVASNSVVTTIKHDESVQDYKIVQKSRHAVNFDIDGDQAADLLSFFPSGDGVYWWAFELSGRIGSTANVTNESGDFRIWKLGNTNGIPFTGDFNGDGWTDFATYESLRDPARAAPPNNWDLYISAPNNSNNYRFSVDREYKLQWGSPLATGVVGDFDGDGKTDIAGFEPQTAEWSIIFAGGDFNQAKALKARSGYGTKRICGEANSKPLVGYFTSSNQMSLLGYTEKSGKLHWQVCDYDHKTNSIVKTGEFIFGAANDLPMIGDINCDSASDLVVFTKHSASWQAASWKYLSTTKSEKPQSVVHWGHGGIHPFVLDFDGDHCADPAFYDPKEGNFRYQVLNSRFLDRGTYLYHNSDFAISRYFPNGPQIPHVALQTMAHQRGVPGQEIWDFVNRPLK